MTITLEIIQTVDQWIRSKVLGCKLVGITDDGEVFLEYESSGVDLELAVDTELRDTFPFINKVVTVSKPSIRQLEATVQELNKILSGETKKKPDLLQIEL